MIERQKSRYGCPESEIKPILDFDFLLSPWAEDNLLRLIMDKRNAANVNRGVEQRYFTFFTSHGILDVNRQCTHRTH